MIPADSNQDQPQPGVAETGEIDRHGLGPAETEDEEHRGADRVEMLQGVEGQPAQVFGRGVPHAIGHPAVGQFVDDDGIQKRYRQKEKRHRIVNRRLRRPIFSPFAQAEYECVPDRYDSV